MFQKRFNLEYNKILITLCSVYGTFKYKRDLFSFPFMKSFVNKKC